MPTQFSFTSKGQVTKLKLAFVTDTIKFFKPYIPIAALEGKLHYFKCNKIVFEILS